MKRINKSDLPTKTCPVCERPFAWRKKWERHWNDVVYCSERCRRMSKKTDRGGKKEAAGQS
jgi:hypothetical protein